MGRGWGLGRLGFGMVAPSALSNSTGRGCSPKSRVVKCWEGRELIFGSWGDNIRTCLRQVKVLQTDWPIIAPSCGGGGGLEGRIVMYLRAHLGVVFMALALGMPVCAQTISTAAGNTTWGGRRT